MQSIFRRLAMMTCGLVVAAGTARAGDVIYQQNLVSDISGMALQTDANLKDPWGLSFSSGSPFWISDQAASVNFSGSPSPVATVYSVPAATAQGGGLNPSGPLLTVGVTNLGGAAPNGQNNGPTGQVSTAAPGITTASTDFNFTVGSSTGKAAFIFANLDGSISAWKGGLTQSVVQATVPGASFTGLAIGNSSSGAQIYAADQNSGNIYIFNSNWQKIGTLTDPNFATFPKGYAAFNVQNLGGTLYVTYANQATGGGIVDEFSTDGKFIKTLINDTSGLWLNAPWGLALAPKNFGLFGGDLLVGNNNAGSNNLTEINAFNPSSGGFVGTLTLSNGKPFSEADLWSISFGNGASGGSHDILYFTAGLGSQTDGLFGALSVPEPSSAVLGLIAVAMMAGGWRMRNRRRSVTP